MDTKKEIHKTSQRKGLLTGVILASSRNGKRKPSCYTSLGQRRNKEAQHYLLERGQVELEELAQAMWAP